MRLLPLSCIAVLWLGCPAIVGEIDSGVDAGFVERDAGPYGYDARPGNPTCTAPAPPPGLSTVTTQRAFVNLSFNVPLAMIQPPGDPSRIFIMERDGRLQVFPNREDAGTAD